MSLYRGAFSCEFSFCAMTPLGAPDFAPCLSDSLLFGLFVFFFSLFWSSLGSVIERSHGTAVTVVQ
jgi:hypothetical protein